MGSGLGGSGRRRGCDAVPLVALHADCPAADLSGEMRSRGGALLLDHPGSLRLGGFCGPVGVANILSFWIRDWGFVLETVNLCGKLATQASSFSGGSCCGSG